MRIELGERLDSETPEGARIGVRGNPDDMPLPAFVNLSALKPGFLRDLGLQPATQPAVIYPNGLGSALKRSN
jgi:hypothetical protein